MWGAHLVFILVFVNPRHPNVADALCDLEPPLRSRVPEYESGLTAARYHFAASFLSFLHPFPFARQKARSC